MSWRLGNKISRAAIDHIFSWASFCRHHSVWTMHDAQILLLLENIKKDNGQKNYEKQLNKKKLWKKQSISQKLLNSITNK